MKAQELEKVLGRFGKAPLTDAELALLFEAYNLIFPSKPKGVTRCPSCVRDVSETVRRNLDLAKTLLNAQV
jgi:hypothetical protein